MQILFCHVFRFLLLPPIDQRNYQEENSILENKSSLLLEKPTALPPIKSSDGVPDKFNLLIKQNCDRVRHEIESQDPTKLSKTRTLHKDIQRGDSWELLKAEKIRCIELEKHQNRMKIEMSYKSKRKQKSTTKKARTKKNKVRGIVFLTRH